ncbi:hypothetical protein MRB53_016206 [Persea americana]|uniref:Uncharacterized protein n=1 Tax=Persea americana TaxID=3435 RepID=A0ACC2M2U1_PERAE|nr:hypothetical protein MRB53_016206 [Persea americana]
MIAITKVENYPVCCWKRTLKKEIFLIYAKAFDLESYRAWKISLEIGALWRQVAPVCGDFCFIYLELWTCSRQHKKLIACRFRLISSLCRRPIAARRAHSYQPRQIFWL